MDGPPAITRSHRPPGGWRWAFAADPPATRVAPWLRVAPGRAGALHSLTLRLVREREGALREDRQWVELAELEELAGERDVSRECMPALLADLERYGVIEQRRGARGAVWRATALAVEAVLEAYAVAHPLVVGPADEGHA